MCDLDPDEMAIPFYLPTDEQTEEDYRRLDQLLMDLYQVLRQILLRPAGVRRNDDAGAARARAAESRPPAASPPPPPPPAPSGRARRRDLPDLVPTAPASRAPTSGAPTSRAPTSGVPTSRAPASGAPDARGCPCARPRRRRRPCCAAAPDAAANAAAASPALDHWLVIGEQLRKIVDEFKTTKKPESPSEPVQGAEGGEVQPPQAPGLKLEVRSSGLFSLLMPHTLPSPVWTTVILLVGWRLLAVRSR